MSLSKSPTATAVAGAISHSAGQTAGHVLMHYLDPTAPETVSAGIGLLIGIMGQFFWPMLLKWREKRLAAMSVFFLAAVLSSVVEAAPTGRISLKERMVKTGTVAEYPVDEWSMRPIVIVNAIAIPLDRRSEFEAGASLSGCYGVVWSPSWWDETDDNPFGSIGFCFETGLVVGSETGGPEGTTYFALQPGAVLTLMHYVAVSFGRRQRLSLTADGRDSGSWVFTLGATVATF